MNKIYIKKLKFENLKQKLIYEFELIFKKFIRKIFVYKFTYEI
jgi:hypothetical protein